MKRICYYLGYDDGDILIRDNPNAETADEVVIQRYDKTKMDWVTDYDMCKIYFGGIPVRNITEEEANEIIRKKQNSNH